MKRKITHSFLTASLLFFTLLGGTPAFADTRYVDAATGNNANSGTAWNQAYKTLAHAIREAHQTLSITEIRVAKGIYYPEYKAGNGTSDRHKAFTITRKGLELLGGYPTSGNGSRDPDANPTIMSGDLGELGNYTDNAYHVLITVGADIDASLKLDGFTIRDGNANGASGDRIFRGAGIFNFAFSSPTFINCIIRDNRTSVGGASYNSNSSPRFINCIISNNTAENGAGIHSLSSTVTVINCTIAGNGTSAISPALFQRFSYATVLSTETAAGSMRAMFNTAWCRA